MFRKIINNYWVGRPKLAQLTTALNQITKTMLPSIVKHVPP
jgi:hypothetical protein